MRALVWIKLVLFGMFTAAFLTVIALLIDQAIRPSRGLLFLDLTYVAYLIVLLLAAVSGAVVAFAALFTRSWRLTMIIAAVVSITLSYGMFRGAVDVYTNETFFDAYAFYADLIQILLNLIIYPVVAVLIWKLFGQELSART